MKAYNYTAVNYQSHIAELLETIVNKARSVVDIPTVISMVLCPYPAI